MTKIQAELGKWSADAALKILSGEKPGNIARTEHHRTDIWVNPVLGEKINLNIPESMIDSCKIYKNR